MRLVAVLVLGACSNPKRLFEEVPIEAPPGMSDLTIDDRGVIWAISERDRVVLELELGKPPIRHPLDGVPDGTDTEGIGWLGEGRFAIGTEGGQQPTAGISFAESRGGHIVVTRTRALSNAELGVT